MLEKIGVGTLRAAPTRTMAPTCASSSEGLPAMMSRCMETVMPLARFCMPTLLFSTNPGPRSTPLAAATAAPSRRAPSTSCHDSGVSFSCPMGTRVTEPMPESTQMFMNFAHMSGRVSSCSIAATPARWKAAFSCVSCLRSVSLRPSARPPNDRPPELDGTSMTPGELTYPTTLHSPPHTTAGPRAFLSISTESRPFCSGTTAVFSPTRLCIASAASGTCQLFTHTSTMSTIPTSWGLSVALQGLMAKGSDPSW
mmetsp:Transcript_21464/g.59617  ORF Transcript_21464/g.59617 Transcript_21464/m.59617 type:complete len:254 (-) Transcript_21464:166-927(-)